MNKLLTKFDPLYYLLSCGHCPPILHDRKHNAATCHACLIQNPKQPLMARIFVLSAVYFERDDL